VGPRRVRDLRCVWGKYGRADLAESQVIDE
jgi:hypothetical protein